MNNTASLYHPRRRTIGRASSPPTWACYEQIPYEEDGYSDSASESCSEDEEDYGRGVAVDHSSDSEEDQSQTVRRDDAGHDIDSMDMDEEGDEVARKLAVAQKDAKGKQRAVNAECSPVRRHHHPKRQRQQVITLRPILTIQKSQGFVWNQDLFIPPYIKDRYVASTSPPNATGFISTSASSTYSALNEYEVEVVEIRVEEGELNDIIP
ncbi:hypothetical protein PC9H_009853 [Pleurotus ostreatus]|uniref:Uncharacterized protein n=3 Tax=Pleurotus TaxID=5320 RepID=A0A067NL14_PLEO1|nr:uncharacterized protein PC9H_009853 [Pleurotus ostreatus]KAF7424546.1 hypothetical protein PC9H_009853 [Pleurotus ostreatus]KAG9224971.1 hypothetical protein CCMSSC00406_0001878 [Pleurotus cornucopiae]KAJ8692498.1 hypothetical protein PTI98_009804 [Pleurotus ostreatus]KDQ24772.1 hypothetical protein PLEOSDRAFT_1090451 [Pleurotus ostreatus PC15]